MGKYSFRAIAGLRESYCACAFKKIVQVFFYNSWLILSMQPSSDWILFSMTSFSIGIITSVCLPISVHASIPLYSFDYGFSVFTNWEFFKDFEHSSHQSKSFQTYSTTTGWSLCNALNKIDRICAVDYTRTDEYDWYVNDASWMREWINMQLRATFLTKRKICEKGEVRQVISQWWWRDSIRVAMRSYGDCEFCRMLWSCWCLDVVNSSNVPNIRCRGPYWILQ